MQFLYPIGFFALAGLTVPLLLHLWNVKRGKTLKIGSISLLGENSSASAKSFRISDWLLFVLRCLLLVLLAFLLAQPYLKKIVSGKNTAGWILVDKANLNPLFKAHRKTIDSLIELGYEVHDFNVGFTPLTLKDTSTIARTIHQNTLNYSSLLNELDILIPPGALVYLYADRHLNNFGDELPAITYQLHWKTLNQSDTLSSWIAEYAGKKFKSQSTPSQTSYEALSTAEASSIKIAIHESPANADRNYLIAALKAIGSFSGRQIIINPPKGKVDIGFWLAEEMVSPSFKAAIISNGTLFQYEQGKIVNSKSFINIDGKHISLSRRIATTGDGEKIWSDGFGNPILSKEKVKELNTFHFYSRFNLKWNELVWNEVFVKALMPIVVQSNSQSDFGFEDHIADQRTLSANQKESVSIAKTGTSFKAQSGEALSPFFWIAALIIFITERILSFTKRRNQDVKK